jgi:hypothetical protein
MSASSRVRVPRRAPTSYSGCLNKISRERKSVNTMFRQGVNDEKQGQANSPYPRQCHAYARERPPARRRSDRYFHGTQRFFSIPVYPIYNRLCVPWKFSLIGHAQTIFPPRSPRSQDRQTINKLVLLCRSKNVLAILAPWRSWREYRTTHALTRQYFHCLYRKNRFFIYRVLCARPCVP